MARNDHLFVVAHYLFCDTIISSVDSVSFKLVKARSRVQAIFLLTPLLLPCRAKRSPSYI